MTQWGVTAEPEQVLIREYEAADATATWEVFHAAVHGTAVHDYTREQLLAWAPPEVDAVEWHERRARARTYVACIDEKVVGFSDFTQDSVLDMLFVHPRAGGRGVARTLVGTILREAAAAGHQRLDVYASRTALPAFSRFGFTLHSSRLPEVRGQRLQNFHMSIELTGQGAGVHGR